MAAAAVGAAQSVLHRRAEEHHERCMFAFVSLLLVTWIELHQLLQLSRIDHIFEPLSRSMLLPGTSDVDKLVKGISRVSGMDPFKGHIVKPVFMAEVVDLSVEPQVCESSLITCVCVCMKSVPHSPSCYLPALGEPSLP